MTVWKSHSDEENMFRTPVVLTWSQCTNVPFVSPKCWFSHQHQRLKHTVPLKERKSLWWREIQMQKVPLLARSGELCREDTDKSLTWAFFLVMSTLSQQYCLKNLLWRQPSSLISSVFTLFTYPSLTQMPLIWCRRDLSFGNGHCRLYSDTRQQCRIPDNSSPHLHSQLSLEGWRLLIGPNTCMFHVQRQKHLSTSRSSFRKGLHNTHIVEKGHMYVGLPCDIRKLCAEPPW